LGLSSSCASKSASSGGYRLRHFGGLAKYCYPAGIFYYGTKLKSYQFSFISRNVYGDLIGKKLNLTIRSYILSNFLVCFFFLMLTISNTEIDDKKLFDVDFHFLKDIFGLYSF